MLNAATKDAAQTVEAEPEATMLDSRLAHLMEACNSLRQRWKRQRNRKLRKRIALLNRDIEHHSAVLCRQQWYAVCQEADGAVSPPVPDQDGNNDTTTHRNQRASDDPGGSKATTPGRSPKTEGTTLTEAHASASTPRKKNGESHGPHEESRQRSARVLRGRGEVSPPAKHWFPAHAGELDAGPNRNEKADTEAHALTSRGSPRSWEPQRPDAEDEEYSITPYGDVLQWYRTSRRLYPPPHRDLQRSEAATLRQLQVQAIWTPVWAKRVCPEVYTTDICQHCKKARATQRHLLWNCAPPLNN
ncbi:hypothetical protein HPB52_024559 [Rhipicephalus sanguineus]|uniref:Uncharacterized protein n=1 Tax=Rhipicephalus sanguineus TaxID=34632 RepID=A0A9D4TE74_RHISA|nr:hypothetical protein HPB52_024559 [Rhipicephalus sanguineus]